ncbi:GyrI-like domain-containing protein [Peribacillus kribbensis]|uniref:GyrI-like domain-containing protein n=1 Tax=Peribacillus kribbensis TaxID=356658 RepID=UPI0004132943|nr:GyrI-like domain-containing protein [Peribacillus kribbensis]
MEYREEVKSSFVVVGYIEAGKWSGDMVYPIPSLWEKARRFISESNADDLTGICLPPRSDHYYYTCGMEIEAVVFSKIENNMTLHTFPEQRYVVFTHIGPSTNISQTYGELWRVFDREGYKIKAGMPEIENVKACMYGKEGTQEYEMEIWIPIQ